MPKPKILQVTMAITLTRPLTTTEMTAAIEAATTALRPLGELSAEVKMPRGAFGA